MSMCVQIKALLMSFPVSVCVPSPFDKDDQASSASTVNKPPTVNKRFSTYNQSPPDTPSLREQAFYVSQPCVISPPRPPHTTHTHTRLPLSLASLGPETPLKLHWACDEATQAPVLAAVHTALSNPNE